MLTGLECASVPSSAIFGTGATKGEEGLIVGLILPSLGAFHKETGPQRGYRDDIESSVEEYRAALDLAEDQNRAEIELSLAVALRVWFDEEGLQDLITESIALSEDALRRTPAQEEERYRNCLRVLGFCLLSRTNVHSRAFPDDLPRAIAIGFESCMTLTAEEDSAKEAEGLLLYGRCLVFQWNNAENNEDLDQALILMERARRLLPSGHSPEPRELHLRHSVLGTLCSAKIRRFFFTSNITEADECIDITTEFLGDTPSYYPRRHDLWSQLGFFHERKFVLTGLLVDLDSSIQAYDEARIGIPDEHPKWSVTHGNYYESLFSRYRLRSKLQDLDAATAGLRQVVRRTSHTANVRDYYVGLLGSVLHAAYAQYGQLDLLDEAVDLYSTSLLHAVPTRLFSAQRNLAAAYHTRFKAHGRSPDISSAVDLFQQAVQSCPSDWQRSEVLASLGDALISRSDITPGLHDIDNAIDALERALAGPSMSDMKRAGYLSLLGVALLRRFDATALPQALYSALERHRLAVHLLPREHHLRPLLLYRWGQAETEAFKHAREFTNKVASIDALEEAVQLTPTGNPQRAMYLLQLSETRAGTLEKHDLQGMIYVMDLLRDAAEDQHSWVPDRFAAATRWATLAHNSQQPSRAIDGYCAAIALLPQVAWLGLERDIRMQRLAASSGNMCYNAAACAISLGDHELAIEMLEHGRSIIWNSGQELRTDVGRLRTIQPDLAQELEEVGAALEFHALDNGSISKDSQEQQLQRRHQLANRWQELIDAVHELPGLERFLLRPKFPDLRPVAGRGAVVILNVSAYRCDALIVTMEHPVLAIRLPHLTAAGAQENVSVLRRAMQLTKDRNGIRFAEQVMVGTLRRLWTAVGGPVSDVLLQLLPQDFRRVWWCPTGPLSFLPVHACGLHDGTRPGVPDLFISSYVPTIASLKRAQLSATMKEESTSFSMLAVCEPETPGKPPLPSAETELEILRELLSETYNCTFLQGPEATVSQVGSLLPSHSWLHLHDGPLSLASISQSRLPSAECAFLSACHSAKGDANLPDEAIHVGAAMMFAGYKCAVATQWAIADKDAPGVAKVFYRHLVRGGKAPDVNDTAEALHRAVQTLRSTLVPAVRWVPFVHLGL